MTYREHFLAHWLLTKITTGDALRKMHFALWCMSRQKCGERVVLSWQYAVAREAKRKATCGYRHSPATIERMKQAQSRRSPEVWARIGESLKGHTHNLGSKRSEKTKAKLASASRNRGPEVKARVSDALRRYHAARRQSAEAI